MLLDRHLTSGPKLSTIFLIASVFGAFSFFFSFLGFFDNQPTTQIIDFRSSISPQEFGGHFLFGYMVALPTRNLKIGVLAGLMALAIDTDHILNASGSQTSIRLSHSIPFSISASVLVGIIASQVFGRQSLGNKMTTTTPTLGASSGNVRKKAMANPTEIHDSMTSVKTKIFFQFLVIAMAAYMSHIAYDVFVDTKANFPLFAPFNFNDVLVPQIYALPIEGAAILLVYLVYAISNAIFYPKSRERYAH
jgi:LexA-binding, inner membrane-associated putative hydrolase